MTSLLQDLRYALRMLRKNPGFTIVAVLALTLGIGADTAIFSVVNSVLLRPLPYDESDRLVFLSERSPVLEGMSISYPNFLDWRAQNDVFETIGVFRRQNYNLTGTGEPVRVMGVWTTASLFDVLGVEPLKGSAFSVEEEEPGKDLVALISQGLWQRRFGADPEIIGKPISLNNINRTIVAVMPASFTFPQKDTDVWIPLALTPQQKQRRFAFSLKSVGRLKPGVTIKQARATRRCSRHSLIENTVRRGGCRWLPYPHAPAGW